MNGLSRRSFLQYGVGTVISGGACLAYDAAYAEGRKEAMATIRQNSLIGLVLAASLMCTPAAEVLEAAAPDSRESARRPNVILIMTDDQGYGDVGCHGNPVLKTPHIDRLADEGVRLTNFHVHTFCSPTRAALMSGLHPSRTGVTATTSRKDMLRTDVPTMADWFKASGYRTALFGKWHIGDGYRYSPRYRGFEETMTVPGGGPGTVGDFWKNNRWNDTFQRNGKPVCYEGFGTDALFTEAMNHIKRIGAEAPFFVYLSPFTPHLPWHLPPEWAEPYGKHGAKLAYVYGTISRIDHNVGRLRAFLKAQGLDQNTILIFTTDNGSVSRESVKFFSGGHRGRKGSLEEHALHFLKGGTYEIEFRRWARELDQPLDASITVEAEKNLRETGRSVTINGGGSRGKALPIAAVSLEIDGKVYQAKAKPGAAAITISFPAKEGPAAMKASFLDRGGKHITGPYYIYIRRLLE